MKSYLREISIKYKMYTLYLFHVNMISYKIVSDSV